MEGKRLGNRGEGEVKEGREEMRERENGGIHVPVKEKKKD